MSDERCATRELEVAGLAPDMAEYPVTDRLVLAGQPQAQDWPALIRRGFGTVVNIRSDPDRAADQARQAEAAGLNYIHLPLPAYELEPEHLATFTGVIARANSGKVLLHCRSATRVALLWLLKRTIYDGWSREQAEAELHRAGYDEEALETLRYCAEDYFDRVTVPALS
jgi:uncharacterized protein (TIGR01244 family)